MKRERWEDTAGRKKRCGADVQSANQSNIDINEQAIINKVDPNKLISEAICLSATLTLSKLTLLLPLSSSICFY